MKKLLIIPMLFICSMVIGQSKKIIGKPIRLQKFEVAQYDFPKKMNWKDAKAACAKLGKGWRLPTQNELNVMYKNKKKIGGFAVDLYWSSHENYYSMNWLVWVDERYIDHGIVNSNGSGEYPYDKCIVRAVRAF